MNDLVERLRSHVPYYEIEGEAADRIEQLEAALSVAHHMLTWRKPDMRCVGNQHIVARNMKQIELALRKEQGLDE